MFSYPPSEDVLADLGDDVVQAIVDCTEFTREDYRRYRGTFPQFAADASERGIANWIHDRLWVHLRRALEEDDRVALKDDGNTRELRVGWKFRARVKRHDAKDRVRSYPTKAALAFWAQTDTFEGYDDIHLGFGYRWDQEARTIGSTIISLHKGLGTKPVWAIEATATAGDQVTTPVGWRFVEPTLPQLDLSEVADEDDGEEGHTS